MYLKKAKIQKDACALTLRCGSVHNSRDTETMEMYTSRVDEGRGAHVPRNITRPHLKGRKSVMCGVMQGLELVVWLSEVRTEKDRYRVILLICGIPKIVQTNLFTNQE